MSEISKANFTVKAFPVEIRKEMVACANRRGQSVAAWLANAIVNQMRIEANDGVLAPVTPPPPVNMTELREVMQAAVAVAQASGKPVPRVTAGHAYALLNTRLRTDRGMPALAPRKRPAPKSKRVIEMQAAE